MRSDLDVLAEIVGSNSTAAITFGDRSAAAELLSGLKAKKHIVAAVIYCGDGKPFASYRRDIASQAPLPALRSFGSRFEGDRLIVYRDIQLASQSAGVIYLESDLGELHQRLTRFAWTVFLILLISSARRWRSPPSSSARSRSRSRTWPGWRRAFPARKITPCGR